MRGRTLRICATVVLLVFATTTVGCVRTIPIKSSELSKLDGANVTEREPKPTVEQPDGDLRELKRMRGVKISLVDSSTYKFDKPLTVEFDDDTLTLRGRHPDPGQKTFELRDIEKTEVRQPAPGATAVVVVSGVLLGGTLLLPVFAAPVVACC